MASDATVRTLTDASKRWQFDAAALQAWRGRILAAQTTPPPRPKVLPTTTAVAAEAASGAVSRTKKRALREMAAAAGTNSREAFLENLRLRQQAAEARLAALQNGDAEPDSDDEAFEAPDPAPLIDEDDDEESESDEDEDMSENEYANELEYFAHELLCLDAINHEPPSGKEVPCTHCADGTKFESEYACAPCAFVQGVCASCRKVVVLRSLADPMRGAAVCLALLADESLLRATLDIGADGETDQETKEEVATIRAQIEFMLDAFFDH